MPGAMVHITIGVLCALIVHFIHFRLEFSLSVFVGNLLPDVIKFGITGIKQLTVNILQIESDPLYHSLNSVTSNYANWFTLGFFIFGLTLLLYHFHYIKKKKMEEYDELYVFLLAGIIIHLALDALIMERSIWF